MRVFESVPGPGDIVKYIDEVVRYAPADVTFTYFSWPSAIFGRYDVFHVHWPEYLARGGNPVKGFIKRQLFRVLLLRLRITSTPVVRTVHNNKPHDAGHVKESKLLAALSGLTRAQVALSKHTGFPDAGAEFVIPHGDFHEVFGRVPRSPQTAGRVLLFGRIQPYKGVIEFLKATESLERSVGEIRIVGLPTAEMRVAIQDELARRDPRSMAVSYDFREVSDLEMVHEISQAELVVLPYKDAGNGNTGVGMVALSLDRPIAVPDSDLMRELEQEVGSEWVHIMAKVSSNEIARVIARARLNSKEEEVNFKGRDWRSVASRYAEVFRWVAGRGEKPAFEIGE